jgi:hypothetical protein
MWVVQTGPPAAVAATFRDNTRKLFGKWYMQRHGVDAKGNVHEMVTLIQVSALLTPLNLRQ